ncbi:MAG: M1 family metallopeptidase [Chitinophagaceae bacterium]|nr:M1 family metallopeptidase [Chitinophagaceae bacterium]
MLNRCLIACVFLTAFLPLFTTAQVTSQKKEYTRADTLRGSITPERSWWDVGWYGIDVFPDFVEKKISGSVTIGFRVIDSGQRMQIDLQEPMQMISIEWNRQALSFRRDGNAWFAYFPVSLKPGTYHQVKVLFEGKPQVAVRPPWDGGWIFAKDMKGRPWMSVACEGLGASVWFPCKDHLSDEPDSARISITVPDTLSAVSNGRLRSVEKKDNGKSTWTWAVANPINNYNIIPYIGKYVHWEETYAGEAGNLDCSYWVMDYNLEKARAQFTQVRPMLQCFEHWFGPYPFYADGYKLVESPHLGMEHQSAVAYGNGFVNGYRGNDLSRSGWGLKWDFIIIHESGHEWLGNNITSKDLADMWIHESFTNYSETIYTECQSGKEAGSAYVQGTRALIENESPIVGRYGVNEEGSGDMYYKGGNMVHYMRQLIGNDSVFRAAMRDMNATFRHQTVTYADVLQYWNRKTGKDFTRLFDQYLTDTRIPVLQWQVKGGKLRYRWSNCIPGYEVPVRVKVDTSTLWLSPKTSWQFLNIKNLPKMGEIENYHGKNPGGLQPFVSIHPDFYCAAERFDGK